jgi:hypothetical protein
MPALIPKQDRISCKSAAAILDWNVAKVRKWANEGKLSKYAPHGSGHGKRFMVSKKEVTALRAALIGAPHAN